MLGLRHFRGTAIDLFQGEITSFVCDLMVTPVFENLEAKDALGLAIYRLGGPVLAHARLKAGSCPIGSIVLSEAGQLPCQKLALSVPPKWLDGHSHEVHPLSQLYHKALEAAAQAALPHVAFSSIGTDSDSGFSIDLAAATAFSALRKFLETHERPVRRITFVLSDRTHYQQYQNELFRIFPEAEEV
jgi:O-acetyl-ADP-ribose deacetylase (regulator of RNase III)